MPSARRCMTLRRHPGCRTTSSPCSSPRMLRSSTGRSRRRRTRPRTPWCRPRRCSGHRRTTGRSRTSHRKHRSRGRRWPDRRSRSCTPSARHCTRTSSCRRCTEVSALRKRSRMLRNWWGRNEPRRTCFRTRSHQRAGRAQPLRHRRRCRRDGSRHQENRASSFRRRQSRSRPLPASRSRVDRCSVRKDPSRRFETVHSDWTRWRIPRSFS